MSTIEIIMVKFLHDVVQPQRRMWPFVRGDNVKLMDSKKEKKKLLN